jgi:hypothetical protein
MSGAHSRDRLGRWLCVGVAFLAFAVYLATLAPGLTFENYGTDGGDLVAAARTLGVPHPPGYPTYTLLAWLFSQLPVGTIAYRVNLFSAASAAISAGLLCRIVQILLPSEVSVLAISVAAGLTFAFSTLLWSQAVISEVYALLTLLAALILWLLLCWRNGGHEANLWLAALTFGVGLGNNLTLALAAPAVLVLLWGRDGDEWKRLLRPRTMLPAAGLLMAGLAVYAYLPLAAQRHPPVNWGNVQTWERFVWMVTAKQYQMFAFGLEPAEMPNRLGSWALVLGDQFGWWGLALALIGGWSWWQRDRQFALFSLVWIFMVGLYAFFYDTLDSHTYLLPPLLLLAVWWAEGARYMLQLIERQWPDWQRAALASILILPFLSLILHWGAVDLSEDRFVHDYIDQALAPLEPGGLVIVRGDKSTFALWYAVYAEEQRPDVAVVSGPLLAYIWYRDHVRHFYPELVLAEPREGDVTTDDLVCELIANNYYQRPVYATDPAEGWEPCFDFVQEGDAPIYRAELKSKWKDEG